MAAYRRPESVIVVVHAGRSVLLLRRVQPFDFWQSVTGSLEPGETAPETAVRETAEETGLLCPGRLIETGVSREFDIDPRWRDRYAPGVARNLEHEFRLPLESAADIRLDSGEHSAFRWLNINDAVDLVWSMTNKAALESLRDDL